MLRFAEPVVFLLLVAFLDYSFVSTFRSYNYEEENPYTGAGMVVKDGVAYRTFPRSGGSSRYRRQAPSPKDEIPNLNAMVAPVRTLSEYELKTNCRCIPFYECCNTTAIIGICPEVIDVRTNKDFTEEHCPVFTETCCDIDTICGTDEKCHLDNQFANLVPPTTPPTPGRTPAPGDNAPPPPPPTEKPIVAPELPPPKNIIKEDPGYKPKCGVRNFEGVGVRIAGDEAKIKQAQYGEFPWMAAIIRVETIGHVEPLDVYVSGGVLISPSVVVTAAHNVIDYAKDHFFNLKVRLGEWDASTDREPFPQADHKIKHMVIHPDFVPGVVLNDVAVIVLEDKVDLSVGRQVGTICLPEIDKGVDYENLNKCIVTGWGKDSFFGKHQNILKLIQVPMVPSQVCQDIMRRATRLGPRFRLHESFLCAGGNGVDACKGDGGSPLVCPFPVDHSPKQNEIRDEDVYYVLTGLVSWGVNCAGEPPGVYVNVPRFMPWLIKFVKENDPGYRYFYRDYN